MAGATNATNATNPACAAFRPRVGVIAIALLLAGCNADPADQIAVPGAPPGGDTRPPITTSTPTSTSTPTANSTSTSTANSTSTSTTGSAPATTRPPTPASTAPVTPTTAGTTRPTTTLLGQTTSIAPTTTQLVYSPEPAEGALRVGVEGPRSLQVQQNLIALGILPATAADSKYGPGTAAGVRRFQESRGLVVDGVAGPATLSALAAAVTELTAPATTG